LQQLPSKHWSAAPLPQRFLPAAQSHWCEAEQVAVDEQSLPPQHAALRIHSLPHSLWVEAHVN
jgi:hypothetical protein